MLYINETLNLTEKRSAGDDRIISLIKVKTLLKFVAVIVDSRRPNCPNRDSVRLMREPITMKY